MKCFNKREVLFFILACCLGIQPSSAIGLATGPTLGLAGYYASFESGMHNTKSMVVHNRALQIGWFAQLNLGLLYAKVTPLVVWDWHRTPNLKEKITSLQHITLPIALGIPLLGFLRPHAGLNFRLSLLRHRSDQEESFIQEYRKKITNCFVGIGIECGKWLVDLDFEVSFASIPEKEIDASLIRSTKTYRPKQFALKVGYNLL